jgi:TRAP-type transport system periplasmic protein
MNVTRVGLFGAVLGMCMSASAAWAETVVLKYSNWMPATYFAWTDVLLPYFAEIEKVTEGRVKVEVLPKVVASAASQFDVVRDGLADMAWFTAGFTPGRFPVAEMADMPLLSNSATIHAPVYDRVYREHMAPMNEFAGVEVLTIFPISPSQVFTRNKPINAPADFSGLKLRSPGTTVTEALSLLGGVPINKTPQEAYEMISTGAIDGQVTPASTVVGMNLQDLTTTAYLLPGGLSNAICMVLINPDKWQSISEADRAAITAISRDVLAARFGTAWEEEDRKSIEVLRANPAYTVVDAAPEHVEELREKFAPLQKAWADRARKAGLDEPEALLDLYRAELEKAAR